MKIDKIGPMGKIGKITEGNAIKGKEGISNEGADILSISQGAKKAQELDSLKNLVFNAIVGLPDVRASKIDIATKRIREGYYNNIDIAESILNPSA
ncbi:MAG: hypothetical protein AB1630_05560 [bacterium]